MSDRTWAEALREAATRWGVVAVLQGGRASAPRPRRCACGSRYLHRRECAVSGKKATVKR